MNEVEYLKDLGVDVIVTDHHEIPDEVPDCIIVNCKFNDDYRYNALCGAGVAYNLVRALVGGRANDYLDLVALATLADSMPLAGENRALVSEGTDAGREYVGLGRSGTGRRRFGRAGRPGGVDVQARRRGQGFGNADSRSRRSAGPLRRHAALGAVRLRLYAFCDVTANLTVL